MEINNGLQIVCPIRGKLNVSKKSKDGLTPTEEFYRVEAIKYLIKKGYPKANFMIEAVIKRFGNNGRNSFRCDFAVLDLPVDKLDSRDIDTLLGHALILCEVKRDNAKNDYVKKTQVEPMLDFALRQDTIGLYWDNIEKRIFWTEFEDGKKNRKEGPLSSLPSYGLKIKQESLTFNTIEGADSLIDVFSRIEDILHQASFSPEQRYSIILQLLLAKIFDEHAYETRPDEPLGIQDYESLGFTAEGTKKKISDIVSRAVKYYGEHLPNKLSNELTLNGETLFRILKILAPVKIIRSKRDVVQTFYMKFAKDLYKWDMAQYFTPTTITDFIVDIINPTFGEHIADPACGSADFLVAAFRIMRKYNPGFADCVWGIDNSSNAVQIAVLNMLLNGDGKSNIKKDDSLENVEKYENKFDVITCNPPFGKKITEKRTNVLLKYDLGHEWSINETGDFVKTDKLVKEQETGILFLEVCVKECREGGRIAIILPNGYLGNRSVKYKIVRQWLLKHTRIAAIISLPRFTFKSSGADVSASVVYLEKRKEVLNTFDESDQYKFAVELIEKVGWDAGNKKGSLIYKRNQEDGAVIIDDDGEPIIDSDFSKVTNNIINSDAANYFDWLTIDKKYKYSPDSTWSVDINEIYKDPDLTLDPKRHSEKFVSLRNRLKENNFFYLGDLLEFIAEKQTSQKKPVQINKSSLYEYVEISDMGRGDFYSKELRGWELPNRAGHFAEPGDIYFGAIWGSAVKWCYIPQNAKNIVITNGCFRCRIKKGKEKYLPDLLSYMNSEGWGVQMRALARGSDGLAEINAEDAKTVIIPELTDELRLEFQPYITNLVMGTTTLNAYTKQLIKNGDLRYYNPPKRPSHIDLV